MNKTLRWISHHDNKKIFIFLYIGLSLVLSIAISLFWLLFAVLVHFAFELVAQSVRKQGASNVLLESLWETKLDFALVVFALWLSVYLDFIFGVAGIGVAARAGAQAASRAGARFAGWHRIIRAVLLSLDDVGNALKAYFASKKSKRKEAAEKLTGKEEQKEEPETEIKTSSTSWTHRWGIADHIGVWMFVLFTLLILIAPWAIGMSWQTIGEIMLKELHPWP